MVILEIKKDQFWCGKAFGRRLMTWDCTYVYPGRELRPLVLPGWQREPKLQPKAQIEHSRILGILNEACKVKHHERN